MNFFDEYIYIGKDGVNEPLTYRRGTKEELGNEFYELEADPVAPHQKNADASKKKKAIYWKLPVIKSGDIDERVKDFVENATEISEAEDSPIDVPMLDIVDVIDDYTADGGRYDKQIHNYYAKQPESGYYYNGNIDGYGEFDSNSKSTDIPIKLHRLDEARKQAVERNKTMYDILENYDEYYNNAMADADDIDEEDEPYTPEEIQRFIEKNNKYYWELTADMRALQTLVQGGDVAAVISNIVQHVAKNKGIDISDYVKGRYNMVTRPVYNVHVVRPEIDKILELYRQDTQNNINEALSGRR